MADYFSTLSTTQKNNIAFIIKRMKEKGITNPISQAGILAVVSKESGFIPKSEISYKNTSNDRIRSIFYKLRNYSDADLNTLKASDENFFNKIYGGMYGNSSTEGYKYRGRGLNQLTFKGNYQAIAPKIGVDIVTYPDKMNELPVATDALIQYFLDRFTAAPVDKLSAYNSTGINDFKNITDSVNAAYHANAGWGHSVNAVKNDGTGGHEKALSRGDGFLTMSKELAESGGNIQLFFLRRVWANKYGKIAIITTGIITLTGIGIFIYDRNLKSKKQK